MVNRPRVKILLMLAYVLLAGSARRAVACECVSTLSPLEEYKETPVVFVGLAQSVDDLLVDVMGSTEKHRAGLKARFIIEEAFKGIGAINVDVVTDAGGGSCGYNFKAGERYLVYAETFVPEPLSLILSQSAIDDGRDTPETTPVVSTSICSRTREIKYAQPDIDMIHAFIEDRPLNHLSGVVLEYVSKSNSSPARDHAFKPVAGLSVKVEGQEGKYQTATDAEGRFRLDNLRPGKYRVVIALPDDYSMLSYGERSEFDIEVKPGLWSEERLIAIKSDSSISGRVHDGAPAGSYLNALQGLSLTSANSDRASLYPR